MRGNIAFKLRKSILKKKRFFLVWEREEPHTSHYHCHWRSSARSRGSSGWRWLSRRWSRTRGKRISSQSWYWETASRRCSSPRHRLPSRRSARHRRSVWVGTSKSYFLGQIENLGNIPMSKPSPSPDLDTSLRKFDPKLANCPPMNLSKILKMVMLVTMFKKREKRYP